MEYSYEWMLDRAYSMIPKERFERKRFEIPVAKVSIEGNKTVILNFKHIVDTINRDAKMVMRYLLRELATSGTFDGQRLILKGIFSPLKVNEKVREFIREYVICPECGCPDTIIVKEERVSFLRCMACGAKKPVKPIK